MDSGDLTAEQLEILRKQVEPVRRFLEALKERMEQQRFPYGDRLRQRVVSACNAAHGLWVALHYMTCDRLAGRKPVHFPLGDAAYRLDVAVNRSRPIPRFEFLQIVDAETPLEAIATLARQGLLTNIENPVIVRVVLEAGADGVATKVVTLEVDRELVLPHVPNGQE